jgi:GntR family transcriptional regulator
MNPYNFELKETIPLHEQLTDHFQSMILAGEIKVDQIIPSVREIALRLSVNPNTVQKAFQTLKHRGFIKVYPGIGSKAAIPAKYDRRAALRQLTPLLEKVVLTANAVCIEEQECQQLLSELWKKYQ